MKRSLLSALIIGLIVGGIVMGLHVSGFLLRPELAITDILSRDGSANRLISDKAQYVIVFLLAIGVAWMTLASSRRARMSAIVGILLLEIIGAAWIFSLYHIFFQPLPALGGAVLGYLAPIGFVAFLGYLERRRLRPKPEPAVVATIPAAQHSLAGSVSGQRVAPPRPGDIKQPRRPIPPHDVAPRTHPGHEPPANQQPPGHLHSRRPAIVEEPGMQAPGAGGAHASTSAPPPAPPAH